MKQRSDLVIRLIALMKLVKAAMLIALGIGLLTMRHEHSWLGDWIHAIAIDPHGKYMSQLLDKIGAMDAHQFMRFGVGSLAYATVFLIEGIGLMLKKPWAEILTVIVTVSFIPLEIYELVVHPTLAKVAVLLINTAVVPYLLWRLRREGHWPFHRRLR
jgi:uncharacterized membrane protein (DUF2068 family)